MRPFAPVRLATRTAGRRIFILLSTRDGLATVLSQTSWLPFRVPLEVVRPLEPKTSSGHDGRGVGDLAVSGSADAGPSSSGSRRDPERLPLAVPGGRR